MRGTVTLQVEHSSALGGVTEESRVGDIDGGRESGKHSPALGCTEFEVAVGNDELRYPSLRLDGQCSSLNAGNRVESRVSDDAHTVRGINEPSQMSCIHVSARKSNSPECNLGVGNEERALVEVGEAGVEVTDSGVLNNEL